MAGGCCRQGCDGVAVRSFEAEAVAILRRVQAARDDLIVANRYFDEYQRIVERSNDAFLAALDDVDRLSDRILSRLPSPWYRRLLRWIRGCVTTPV